MSTQEPRRVMFICRQNSRRSQIAHGLLVDRAPNDVEVSSAGLDGAGGLAAEAIAVMEENGIDLRAQSSNVLQEYQPEHFDTVVVLCGCLLEFPPDWRQRPWVEDWDIADPVAGDLDSHRRARDFISKRIDSLLNQLAQS